MLTCHSCQVDREVLIDTGLNKFELKSAYKMYFESWINVEWEQKQNCCVYVWASADEKHEAHIKHTESYNLERERENPGHNYKPNGSDKRENCNTEFSILYLIFNMSKNKARSILVYGWTVMVSVYHFYSWIFNFQLQFSHVIPVMFVVKVSGSWIEVPDHLLY